jgi:hypothetical protein
MAYYRDMVLQEGEYTYSANIQFDIESDKKLARFIPNETTIALLKEYFIDIIRHNTSVHSRILYGSYGTGKSHFLTVLSMLLEKRYSKGKAFCTFIDRIEEFDSDLSSDLKNYANDLSKKPYIIVPVISDFEDFDRCLYFSLKKTLDNIGLNLIYKNFYTQALALIDQWKAQPDSFERLVTACEKEKTSLNQVEKLLKEFNSKSEQLFKQIFSYVTYGVEYVYEVSSMSEVLDQANVSLTEEYSGIVFIFDEFGRYLEDNIKKMKVKKVQDIAEYCDHSGYDNHVILVSHKEIGQYTKEYGRSVINEWKKVEGRYRSTPINDKQDQCLSLMNSILRKDTSLWDEYREKHALQLEEMYTQAMDFKGFLIKATERNKPFEGGFPLHPISLFALDKLSKKVAQNERTFFTYLAGKEEYSLYHFLARHKLNTFHFVGIDEIYNYFESSIKSIQSDSSYEPYKKLQSALIKAKLNIQNKCIEVKILKVIAIINIIHDAGALVANKRTILSVIDNEAEAIKSAMQNLIDKKIIKYSRAYDKYDFFDTSIFNIEEMIETEIENISDEMVCKTLNSEFIDFVLYPYDHNNNYKINRVFIPVFTTMEEISKKGFLRQLPEYYDGVLLLTLGDWDTDIKSIVERCNTIPRSIVLLNRDSVQIKLEVKKYMAILYLESRKTIYVSQDPSFESELSYFKAEQYSIVRRQIDAWKKLDSNSVNVVSEGCMHEGNNTFMKLSTTASHIVNKSFENTLVVNNELINKNAISSSMVSAKKNAIKAILDGASKDPYYGLKILSPEYICVRSLLVKNGFYQTGEDIVQNELKDGAVPQQAVWDKIQLFIESLKKTVNSFSEIYCDLKKPPFGLRDGYLSLLFAFAFLPYKKSIIISSHGVEQEITVDIFEEMIRRPCDFMLSITNWTKKQQQYIDRLENLYFEYMDATIFRKNRLKAIYEAMFAHYKSIPKFARKTNIFVSDKTKLYRKLMEQSHTNYSTFLMNHLAELADGYTTAFELIKTIKHELDNVHVNLLIELERKLIDVLAPDSKQRSLSLIMIALYGESWKEKRQRSFNYYTNAWLELSSKITEQLSNEDIIARLSKALTGFELNYWNDTHIEDFTAKVVEITTKLKSYEVTDILGNDETRITLSSADGTSKTIVLSTKELSQISYTMKNKINSTLDNFGLSVTYEEKVRVLFATLQDLLKGE